MWLVCVDAYSQYPYVTQMKTTTTADTIMALSAIFAIEGLRETLVSDNGPQLTADLFKKFCAGNGIRHITSAPFHPASNGLAERFVRTFKAAMLKNIQDGLPISAALIKYLSTYRSVPNAAGKTPVQLLHGRTVRTLLSQTLPITHKQNESKQYDSPKFKPSQPVYFRNYSRGSKWVKGHIDRVLGKMMYVVDTPKERYEELPLAKSYPDVAIQKRLSGAERVVERSSNAAADPSTSLRELSVAEPLRRSERNRKPVDRFEAEDFRK
ncbi:PREDICTED: uncharacterized protein K02A2.6-like [Rhagoletis zephyria]|uniref:uncharacterized protein K02A2.6-like n=1 Tax=Rhagoletis zephyria TaxID=28612 RepID=UPI0008116C51|nr:PREDICTED: uncharacterized protein K02A2.6-like [Rhagoletis zephyria]